MQHVTFYTRRYKREVTVFLESCGLNGTAQSGQIGDEHFFTLPYTTFRDIITVEKFVCFIIKTVLSENAVTNCSAKLCQYMKEAVFDADKSNLLYDFATTIECKKAINIDGYIKFKMQSYTMKIDKILYSIVRREYK